MASIEIRLWGGPKCGEHIELNTGLYGHLPDELEFQVALPPPILEEVLTADEMELAQVQYTKLVYVLRGSRGEDGMIIYEYAPYVSC